MTIVKVIAVQIIGLMAVSGEADLRDHPDQRRFGSMVVKTIRRKQTRLGTRVHSV